MASLPDWSRRAISRAWRPRTVLVHVSPRPTTLAERRSVLQYLQSKCGIDAFKMSPNPSQFMAVTKDQDSADELMSSSPQKYSIELPRRAQDMRFMDLKRPNMVDTTRASILPSDGATPSGESQQQQQQQEFVLRIFPPVDYTHGGTMESSPLHGPWPTSYTAEDSHTSAILRQTLPHTTAAAGLARWDYNLELYNGRMSPKAARLLVAGWMPGNMAKQQQQEQASPDGHDQQEKKAHRLS